MRDACAPNLSRKRRDSGGIRIPIWLVAGIGIQSNTTGGLHQSQQVEHFVAQARHERQ